MPTRGGMRLPAFRRCLAGFMLVESPLLLLRLTPTLTLRLNEVFPDPNFWMFWLSTRTSLIVRASCPDPLLWFDTVLEAAGGEFSPWEGLFFTFFLLSFKSWCSFMGKIISQSGNSEIINFIYSKAIQYGK